MGINLGFENLGMNPKASGELSYEYLDSLVQFHQAASDVLELCHDLTATTRTYDSICTISKCIKKYGVTQSLEALYGENFSSAASMEAEAEEAKKGLGQKIKEIIRALKKKIVRFFQWLFSQKERTKQALMKLDCKNEIKYKDVDGKEVTVAAGQCKSHAKTLITAINNAGSDKSRLEKDLDDAEKAETVDQNKVDELRQLIQEAVKEGKNAIANANAFIAAAKKAAGPRKPQSPDATPGEDPEQDTTDYSQTAHETDKRRTR